MEIVEFEAARVMGTVIRDMTPNGLVEMHSRLSAEATDDGRTKITGDLDIPAMKEQIDPGPIEASLSKMKELIETETATGRDR